MRIKMYMSRILAEDTHCTDSNHRHEDVKENSLLFKELNFGKKKWEVEVPTTGLSSILPFFSFQTNVVQDLAKVPTRRQIEQFINSIMRKMRLSKEVCVLSFIFIEKVLTKGGVQLLTINWRPIVYSSILIASKYWEDYNFWNVDFASSCKLFSVEATNRLESTFLALCSYRRGILN